MIRRFGPWLGAAAALIIAACIDMSAPRSGVLSITPLLLPSPSVVVGDVMRDSLGVPTPLSIIAFDDKSQPVPGLPAGFFVLDRGAHVDGTGLFFGDSLSSVRVVGTMAGIQTLPVTVPVTVAPENIARVGTADSIVANIGGDSTQNGSNPLTVTVSGAGTTAPGVVGVVVRYRITYSPPALAGQPPTAYIGDDGSRPSAVDTTDPSGRASRRAILRVKSLGAPLPDSIIVEASASYKGTALRGSPVRFAVRAKP